MKMKPTKRDISNKDGGVDIPTPPLPKGIEIAPPEDQPVRGAIGTTEEQARRNQQNLKSALEAELKASSSHTSSSNERSKDIDVNALSNGWTPLQFPSKLIPYDVTEVEVRPMDIRVLSRVAAAQSQQSLTLLIDAIQSCCSFDLRSMTVPDYYYFMYWLRINSYPKTPLKVNWTSKYGNQNSTITRMSTYDIKELEITKARYQEFLDRGMCIPTMRSLEYSSNQENIDEEREFLISYAQYVYVEGNELDSDYMDRKVAKLLEMGADFMTDVEEFTKEVEHGVLEQVRVVDEHFVLEKAITNMEEEVENVIKIIDNAIDTNDLNTITSMAAMSQHVDKRKIEIAELKEKLEKGEKVEPEEEVVDIGVADATLLFP